MFHKIHIAFDMYVTPNDGAMAADVTEGRSPKVAPIAPVQLLR